jgi:hypothetical protein
VTEISMDSIYHKEPPVLVDSIKADFELNLWTVRLMDTRAAVGGGMYLCFHVVDADEAAIIDRAVAELREAPEPETPAKRGRKPKVAKPDISDLSQPFGDDQQSTSGATHD